MISALTSRPLVRRRGGALPITFGFLCVAGTFFVLSGAGPRLLGTHRAGGLTVVITVASIFGFGVAVPIEQLISRRLNVDPEAAVSRPLTWLVGGAGLAIVAALAGGPSLPAASVFSPLVPGMVVAALGWAAVVAVRCRLAGSGDLVAYALVLLVEAFARIAMVALAVLLPGQKASLLALAVGAPLLLAAGTGLVFEHRTTAEPESPTMPGAAGEQVSFIAVSVGYQICLNTLPLFLDLKQAGLVAAAGIANSYFLAPTVAMGGITTHALVNLSQAWGEHDFEAFRAARRTAQRNGALVAVGLTAIAAALAPVILPLYYSKPSLGLPFALLSAMAVSTVITVIAAVAMQPLLAAGHGRAAALSWTAGAALTVTAIGLSNGTSWLADLGLVAGPGVALTGALWSVSQVLHHWEDPAPRAGATSGAR